MTMDLSNLSWAIVRDLHPPEGFSQREWEIITALREYVELGGIPAAHKSMELLNAANRLTSALRAYEPTP